MLEDFSLEYKSRNNLKVQIRQKFKQKNLKKIQNDTWFKCMQSGRNTMLEIQKSPLISEAFEDLKDLDLDIPTNSYNKSIAVQYSLNKKKRWLFFEYLKDKVLNEEINKCKLEAYFQHRSKILLSNQKKEQFNGHIKKPKTRLIDLNKFKKEKLICKNGNRNRHSIKLPNNKTLIDQVENQREFNIQPEITYHFTIAKSLVNIRQVRRYYGTSKFKFDQKQNEYVRLEKKNRQK